MQTTPLYKLQDQFIEQVEEFSEVKEVITTEKFVEKLPRSAVYSPYDVLVQFHDTSDITRDEFLTQLLDEDIEFDRITGMGRHDGNNNFYAYVSLEAHPLS
jgi:hypothetical protein